MKKLDPRVIMFNVAAGVVTVAALVALVRSLVVSPTAQPCSERYLASTVFALERGGVALAAADLQSGLGGRDAGLIDNVAVVRLKDAPVPLAMRVNLPKGSASPRGPAVPKGGMSFPWQPRSVQGKSAACLSYSVFLPADFDFHRGGALPGIQGSDTGEDRFAALVSWRFGAEGGATNIVTREGVTQANRVERESFAFPRGRWVKLEQEVVLNNPKQADGVVRIWLDDTLALERGDVTFRSKPEVTVSGVAADVFYGGEDTTRTAPKDTTVLLSPFVLRWQ